VCGPHDNTNVTHVALGGPSVWHVWSTAQGAQIDSPEHNFIPISVYSTRRCADRQSWTQLYTDHCLQHKTVRRSTVLNTICTSTAQDLRTDLHCRPDSRKLFSTAVFNYLWRVKQFVTMYELCILWARHWGCHVKGLAQTTWIRKRNSEANTGN